VTDESICAVIESLVSGPVAVTGVVREHVVHGVDNSDPVSLRPSEVEEFERRQDFEER